MTVRIALALAAGAAVLLSAAPAGANEGCPRGKTPLYVGPVLVACLPDSP